MGEVYAACQGFGGVDNKVIADLIKSSLLVHTIYIFRTQVLPGTCSRAMNDNSINFLHFTVHFLY